MRIDAHQAPTLAADTASLAQAIGVDPRWVSDAIAAYEAALRRASDLDVRWVEADGRLTVSAVVWLTRRHAGHPGGDLP